MKRGFGSDNHSGISPEVLKAIYDANIDHALAYGDDEYSAFFGGCFYPLFKSNNGVFRHGKSHPFPIIKLQAVKYVNTKAEM